MTNFHIVIPYYNNWDLLHQLLGDLWRLERENISSILIVDDLSEEKDGLKFWQENMFKVEVIRNEENLGFLKTSNIGLRDRAEKYPDDFVCLISTDVLIKSKFIDYIKVLYADNSDIPLFGGRLLSTDTGWNKFGNEIFHYLEGWFLCAKGWSWAELGYFDEQYAPNDFEDVDLSTKALRLGYDLIPLNSPGVQHIGGKSIGYSDERFRLTNTNKKKFEEKWIPKQ